jgi:hypothetical protein
MNRQFFILAVNFAAMAMAFVPTLPAGNKTIGSGNS